MLCRKYIEGCSGNMCLLSHRNGIHDPRLIAEKYPGAHPFESKDIVPNEEFPYRESLPVELRKKAAQYAPFSSAVFSEAANALEAKDAEIERLKSILATERAWLVKRNESLVKARAALEEAT